MNPWLPIIMPLHLGSLSSITLNILLALLPSTLIRLLCMSGLSHLSMHQVWLHFIIYPGHLLHCNWVSKTLDWTFIHESVDLVHRGYSLSLISKWVMFWHCLDALTYAGAVLGFAKPRALTEQQVAGHTPSPVSPKYLKYMKYTVYQHIPSNVCLFLICLAHALKWTGNQFWLNILIFLNAKTSLLAFDGLQ